MDRETIEKALAVCEFCVGLAPEELGKIAEHCQVETYGPGTPVFRQGDRGEHMYVIVDGQVMLERSIDLGGRTGSVAISVLAAGKVMGCWSTLLGEEHLLMSSAVCQKPTTVLAIRGADLREMMLNNTGLGFNVLERLCFLLRERVQAAYGAMEKI